MTTLASLAHDPNASAFRKLPVPISVNFARTSGTLRTLEGQVAYAAGDAIATGPAGDTWPIKRARFAVTYDAVEPTVFGESGSYCRRPNEVLAKQQSAAFSVQTPAGAVLTGRPGDWLLEYGPGDQSVVADAIFKSTYAPIAS